MNRSPIILGMPSNDAIQVRCTVETALKIHKQDPKEKEGDILCFLPSGEDVDQAIRMAEEAVDNDKLLDHNKIVFLPLYASLPYSMQARVFQPQHGRRTSRRVIFATNLAETSVTGKLCVNALCLGGGCMYICRCVWIP